MATHLRQQIRAAMVTQLTGLTTTGTRVFDSLARNMEPAEQPSLRICADQEAPSRLIEPMRPWLIERSFVLAVEVAVLQNTAGYQDLLDEIIKEVEVAIDAANNPMRAFCKKIIPAGYAKPDFQGTADTIIAYQELRFEVTYYTRQGTPDVPA
jgi:hypothetical protein